MKKIVLVLTALVLASGGAFAQKKKKGGSSSVAEVPRQDKKVSIQDKTKSCKKMEGLFTLYQDTTNGSAYMLVRKEQLSKNYIYFSYTENGVVGAGHFRGNFRDNKVFTINRYFDRLEFVVLNNRFYFDPASELSRASQANISPAVLVSQKIIAEDKSGDMLLDAGAIFLSESMHQVKPTPAPPPFNSSSLLGSLSKEKTKFASMRNYEKNTDLLVEYVYENPQPTSRGGGDVTDSRAVSIVLQHSLMEAPEKVMQARADDARVGYFNELINDMTTTDAVNYRDVIHRWRLEKRDKNAAISEPVKPITWWIEKTTPKEFRETIKAAGMQWNLAFEKAGFKNAVEVKEQPDTATWDAGDIRYNVLRWTSSPQPPFGGYGPSFVDPRSGEILGADIMLEFIFVTNRIKQEQLFDATVPGYQFTPDEHFCSAGEYMHLNGMFGFTALQTRGLSEVEKRDYLQQSLYYLVLHEMGHTMGLMHNMKASQLWNPQQVHNKMLTRQYGLTASVMDYPAANVALDKTKQGDYFTTRPGPYDLWAIEYGYSQAADAPAQERERLNKILDRSTDSTLIFGNDADDMRSSGNGIDPRVNINDMSNDAITYSVDRIKLVNQMIPKLKDKYVKDGQSYQELVQAYSLSMGEWMNAAITISRYIGGVYVQRAVAGQNGATKPFTPVEYKDQKRAMQALSQYMFAPNAFVFSADLYNHLQVQRRGFNFFGINEDPKIHSRVLNMQTQILGQLLDDKMLERLTNSRMYGNKYSAYEMLTDLTDACFREDMAGNANTFRQNLQVEYVRELLDAAGVGNAKNTSNGYDDVSHAALLAQVKNIRRMMATPAAANAETKAHRDHIVFMIDQAFNK